MLLSTATIQMFCDAKSCIAECTRTGFDTTKVTNQILKEEGWTMIESGRDGERTVYRHLCPEHSKKLPDAVELKE